MPASSRHIVRHALSWIVVGLIAGGLWHLPARLLDAALSGATAGAIRLADTRGSIWAGSGQLQWWPQAGSRVRDTDSSSAPVDQMVSSAAVVLVDRLSWQVVASVIGDADAGLAPMSVGVLLESPSFQGDIRSKVLVAPSLASILGWTAPRWSLPSGSMDLPPANLQGSPHPLLAIAAPTFVSRVQWRGLSSTSVSGEETRVDIEFRQFGTALSPVRPLGHYRLTLQRESGRWGWQLVSEPDSALDMTGRGGMGRGPSGSVQFRCQRDCEFMAGLLALIGKRQGSTYELQLGL